MLLQSSSRGGRALRQLQQALRAAAAPAAPAANTSAGSSTAQQQGVLHQLLAGEAAVNSSSRCCCRAFSEYAAPGSRGAGAGLRRVNPSGSSPSGSGGAGAAAAAAASTSGSSGSGTLLAEMQEVPGGARPMRRWEYYYWGLGATGIAYILYSRMKTPDKTPEEQAETERLLVELRARRKDHVRSVLVAQNFLLGEEDPLDGLSPAQIVLFCEKYGIDPSDPLEGLTPEEIDAYMAQQAASKQQDGAEVE